MLDGIELSYFTDQAEMILRIIVSVLLGAVIGYERERSHKPAG